MNTKRLPLILPAELYERLAERAERNERIPEQEVRAILRRILTKSPAQVTK